MLSSLLAGQVISIHAPSRERRQVLFCRPAGRRHFNPRSLAGATEKIKDMEEIVCISIHAPSRERQWSMEDMQKAGLFQSTLPRGSDYNLICARFFRQRFQSTLPRGSDAGINFKQRARCNFNPRSLAGATKKIDDSTSSAGISIHAPSRERPIQNNQQDYQRHFNPRSLAGATYYCRSYSSG